MCHESTGIALTEPIGIGKGTVTLEDFEHAEADLRGRPEPRHQPSAHAGRAARGGEARRRIVAVNPLRERGLVRFANPQSPKDMLTGSSTPIASRYFQPRIGGDLAVADRACSRRLRRRATRSTAPSSPQHTTGFEALRGRHRRPRAWERLEARSRASPRAQIERSRAICTPRSSATIVCWAMGLTQHRTRVATIQKLVNLLLLRGNIGKPGAGPCPVRGHSQRAGRPHDGHLRAAAGGLPRRARRGVRLRAAARARATTRSARSRRCATAARRCSSRWAATSPPPRPTPARTGAALRTLRAHRARLDQAQPLAPGARARGADPALPRPQRARRAGRRPAGGDRRGFDEHGAPVRGHEGAGLAAAAVASRRSWRGWRAPRLPRSRTPWLRAGRRLRPHPRPHRRAWSRASRTSTRGCASPAASTCTIPARERVFPTASGRATFHAHPLRGRCARVPARRSC